MARCAEDAAATSGEGGTDDSDMAARMQLWHAANQRDDGECCGGLRGYDSDQCVRLRRASRGQSGKLDTAVCAIDGSDRRQKATLDASGRIVLNGPDMCLQAVRRSSLAEEEIVQAVPCDRMAEHRARPQGCPRGAKQRESVA